MAAVASTTSRIPVVKLGWRRSLGDARARSAATGKPVLWLQTLGEIGGFA